MGKNKGIILLLLLAMACAVLTGCGKDNKSVDKAPLVKTQQAGNGTENNQGTYSGTVRGRYETNLSFQVGGQILARNVQMGSRVRAGDVLMVINAKDIVRKPMRAMHRYPRLVRSLTWHSEI